VSYSPNSSWNVSLSVPYVVRTHSTYGDFDAAAEQLPELSSSRSSSLGDVRLIGATRDCCRHTIWECKLGVKLPTGHYGTAVNFSGGPNAGTPLDASLQPGTGSTDIIVGAYYFQAISQDLDFFAKWAVSERRQTPHGPAGQRLPAGKCNDGELRPALRKPIRV